MKLTNLIITCLLTIVLGCKGMNITEASKAQTKQQLVLGSIGSEKQYILQQRFNGSAIPSYKRPIKLEVNQITFNKQTFKLFIKANSSQASNVSIQYVDSLAKKPNYVQLQVVDKLAVVEAMNNRENHGIKNYLSHNRYANVVTSISMALNQKAFEAITTADAVFLIEKKPKIYVMQTYQDHKKSDVISFSDGVVFQYQTSNCCWQENERHQLNIVDLVGSYFNCPKNTYKSSSRAKKNINYYKL
ncbi:hypothetical protein [Jejuia pallidilutea]|nr:hypothetical protein [Jejuia pallidilutea]